MCLVANERAHAICLDQHICICCASPKHPNVTITYSCAPGPPLGARISAYGHCLPHDHPSACGLLGASLDLASILPGPQLTVASWVLHAELPMATYKLRDETQVVLHGWSNHYAPKHSPAQATPNIHLQLTNGLMSRNSWACRALTDGQQHAEAWDAQAWM